MKTALAFISITLCCGLTIGCSTGTNNANPAPTKTAVSTPPGVTSKITAVDPKVNTAFFDKSGIKMQNLENKAVLIDAKTLALALTGSSSCPSIPEMTSVLDDKLTVTLKDTGAPCTADLTVYFWEITLPGILSPRTTDLSVDIVYPRGIKLTLIASAPK